MTASIDGKGHIRGEREQEVTEEATIYDVTTQLVHSILSYLPLNDLACSAALVCKKWRKKQLRFFKENITTRYQIANRLISLPDKDLETIKSPEIARLVECASATYLYTFDIWLEARYPLNKKARDAIETVYSVTLAQDEKLVGIKVEGAKLQDPDSLEKFTYVPSSLLDSSSYDRFKLTLPNKKIAELRLRSSIRNPLDQLKQLLNEEAADTQPVSLNIDYIVPKFRYFDFNAVFKEAIASQLE